MAIGNILKQGTYSVIDNIVINKNNKNYGFLFSVFENNLKQKMIVEKYYNFSCIVNICKIVDKVYTINNFTSNLTDIYYNNPKDSINLPGIYSVSRKEIEQLDEKGEITKKIEVELNRNYSYNFIYFNEKYYNCKNEIIEVSGIQTDHFFDISIYPSINKNLVEVLYTVLLKEEPSYGDYPKV